MTDSTGRHTRPRIDIVQTRTLSNGRQIVDDLRARGIGSDRRAGCEASALVGRCRLIPAGEQGRRPGGIEQQGQAPPRYGPEGPALRRGADGRESPLTASKYAGAAAGRQVDARVKVGGDSRLPANEASRQTQLIESVLPARPAGVFVRDESVDVHHHPTPP
jgi:hypothetical protein